MVEHWIVAPGTRDRNPPVTPHFERRKTMVCEKCGREERQHVNGRVKMVARLAPDAYSVICSMCTYVLLHRSLNKEAIKKEGG